MNEQEQAAEVARIVRSYVAEVVLPLMQEISALKEAQKTLEGSIEDQECSLQDTQNGWLSLGARLDGLETTLKMLPAPKDGIDGKDGRDGIDGKDGAPGEKGDKGDQGAAGRDGIDGKDDNAGRDGIDGEKGDPGRDGKDGAPGMKGDKGERGEDGRHGLDGKQGEKGLDGKDGRDGRDSKDGRDGKDGDPGRDAAQLDILPAIDATKSYAKGTYASHLGGLWRATRQTDGMDGWDIVIDGVSRFGFHQVGKRAFELVTVQSSGAEQKKSFAIPIMTYEGIYKADRIYEPGDAVTWGGSLWHCDEANPNKPGEGKGWTLVAKRGRDGKNGDKGEKGEPGRNGRDAATKEWNPSV